MRDLLNVLLELCYHSSFLPKTVKQKLEMEDCLIKAVTICYKI